VYDQGNSDALQLATIDPATGKLTKLTSVSLGAGIAENAWYGVRMTVQVFGGPVGVVSVTGGVFRHTTPTDANSNIVLPPLGIVGFSGSLSALGLDNQGEVGITASAFSTNVNSSVTNFLLGVCHQPT